MTIIDTLTAALHRARADGGKPIEIEISRDDLLALQSNRDFMLAQPMREGAPLTFGGVPLREVREGGPTVRCRPAPKP